MGDEEVGDAEVRLQILQKVEDLRLDRYVERGDRLIANDELRAQRDGARDADALALPAGELVGIAIDMLRVESDAVHELTHGLLHATGRLDLLDPEGGAEDRADGLPRVERVVGVLEDHLRLLAHGAHGTARESRDVSAVDDHVAGGRVDQAQDGAARRRLPAAALPHQAQGLRPTEFEAHAIDGLDLPDRAREDTSRLVREVDAQVLDLEHFFAHSAPPVAPGCAR